MADLSIDLQRELPAPVEDAYGWLTDFEAADGGRAGARTDQGADGDRSARARLLLSTQCSLLGSLRAPCGLHRMWDGDGEALREELG